jgi:hypothetical protein
LSRGKEGKPERMSWGIGDVDCGCRSGSGARGKERGSWAVSGAGEEETVGEEGADRWALSVREREREREKGDAGLGWFGCWAGGSGSAQLGWFLFFLFFFLFFSVSVFFLSFANWLQTYSNNFVNFSKIQSIKVGQSETGFQNKIRFSIKPYKF